MKLEKSIFISSTNLSVQKRNQNLADYSIFIIYYIYLKLPPPPPLIEKCDFGEFMTNDPRMYGECEHLLKVSANVRRVFAEKNALGLHQSRGLMKEDVMYVMR